MPARNLEQQTSTEAANRAEFHEKLVILQSLIETDEQRAHGYVDGMEFDSVNQRKRAEERWKKNNEKLLGHTEKSIEEMGAVPEFIPQPTPSPEYGVPPTLSYKTPKVTTGNGKDKSWIDPIILGSHITPNMHVGVFWDLENIVLSVRWPNIPYPVILKKLSKFAQKFGKIEKFAAYADAVKGRGIHREKKTALLENAIEMVNVPGNYHFEAADKAILVDMCLFAGDYQPSETVIILISGDGDFAMALSQLKRKGYTTVVVVNDDMNVKRSLQTSASYYIHTSQIIGARSQLRSKRKESSYRDYVGQSPNGQRKFPTFHPGNKGKKKSERQIFSKRVNLSTRRNGGGFSNKKSGRQSKPSNRPLMTTPAPVQPSIPPQPMPPFPMQYQAQPFPTFRPGLPMPLHPMPMPLHPMQPMPPIPPPMMPPLHPMPMPVQQSTLQQQQQPVSHSPPTQN